MGWSLDIAPWSSLFEGWSACVLGGVGSMRMQWFGSKYGTFFLTE